MSTFLRLTYRWARRVAIAVLGGTVVLIGICMIVLPGPAVLVIPAGLAILGLEFAWAKQWLEKVRESGGQLFSWSSRLWRRDDRK
ncbi:MAG: PGPGW domain-containing protein [Povalibacter sp.]